jgi:hypothetical protein
MVHSGYELVTRSVITAVDSFEVRPYELSIADLAANPSGNTLSFFKESSYVGHGNLTRKCLAIGCEVTAELMVEPTELESIGGAERGLDYAISTLIMQAFSNCYDEGS